MYNEIKVEVLGHKDSKEIYNINIDNIGYYRGYTETSPEMGVKPKLVTMLYLKGSVKALKVNCSKDELERKINEVKKEQ